MKNNNTVTIKEIQEWQVRNFPNALPHQPLLGMVEECGELLESTNNEQLEDAIGDVLIFMSHYIALNHLDISYCFIGRPPKGQNLIANLGALCHAHLKGEQKIRGTEAESQEKKVYALVEILCDLAHFANGLGKTSQECLESAWKEVKKRDWIKFPGDGKTI